jgi:hypothetical protein
VQKGKRQGAPLALTFLNIVFCGQQNRGGAELLFQLYFRVGDEILQLEKKIVEDGQNEQYKKSRSG